MEYLFLIIILIFSIVIHEVSHGAVANYLGDPTAKYAGRLTLNPIKHLDPIGSVILPVFLILMAKIMGGGIIFGWAKPVPINPYNFRDQKYGSAKVALAGPGVNLAIALFFGLLLRFLLIPAGFTVDLAHLPFTFGDAIASIVYINILLAIFNLLPVPPLDGSHIFFTFLPSSMENLKIFLSQFGLFILLFIIFFLFRWIILIINLIFILIVGSPLF
jgi:Zn-dependent protease